MRNRERESRDGIWAGGDWSTRIRENHLLQRHVSVPQTYRKVSFLSFSFFVGPEFVNLFLASWKIKNCIPKTCNIYKLFFQVIQFKCDVLLLLVCTGRLLLSIWILLMTLCRILFHFIYIWVYSVCCFGCSVVEIKFPLRKFIGTNALWTLRIL